MKRIRLTLEFELDDNGMYNVHMGDDRGSSGIELSNGKSVDEAVNSIGIYMKQVVEDALNEED